MRFALVPAGTFGPYFAEGDSGRVAVWAQSGEKGKAWFSLGFDPSGKVRAPAEKLGAAPEEVGLAVLEPVLGGFALLTTHASGGRTTIEAFELAENGRPKAASTILSQVNGDVVWIDWVRTARGTLALWAVKSPDGADLFATMLGMEREEPKPFVQGARAWQAQPFDSGAAVATVRAGGKGTSGGRVELDLLDDVGAPKSKLDVSTSPTAESDLDMVAVERSLVLAWTDQRALESRVMLAVVDATGKLAKPAADALPEIGEQALVRLVPPHPRGGRAHLAYESLLDRPAAFRRISLASIESDGTLGKPRVELDHHAKDGSIPELTATRSGLAALTLAPACAKGADCKSAAKLPTFVELDANLAVTASEPLRLLALDGASPDLAWGLSCRESPCRVLAAQATSPAPLFAVTLDAHSSSYEPAAKLHARASPPRVLSSEVLAKSDPLADVALTRMGKSALAAWVTYSDPSAPWERLTKPAPDGKLDPVRALLQVRPLPESGTAPVETVSLRARSLGGVALGTTTTGVAESLLGWTAIDFKVPQVFVTVLDEKGKKLRQRMLTRAPGEKSDVAVAGNGDGFVVAWVDERNQDPEVYAVRLNRQLMSAGPEKRITNAKGPASEVTLLDRDSDVLVAWSEARDVEHPGVADIYVAALRATDATVSGSEQIVAKTPKHSRSPALGRFGKTTLLAWVDESISGSGETSAGEARVIELTPEGKPQGTSLALSVPDASANAVAVDCSEQRCRLLLGVSRQGASELWVSEWNEGKLSAPSRLMSLSGTADSPVPPALIGRDALVADRSGSFGRTRWVRIEWK